MNHIYKIKLMKISYSIQNARYRVDTKGANIKNVGEGGQGGGGSYKLFKKILCSPGDHRPKYFMVQ